MSGEAVYKLSVWRVVRSEWIKLITLRSTWGTMVALIATAVGVGVVACAAVAGSLHGTGGSGATGAFGVNGPTSTVLTGATLAVLVTAVFGVLAGAREYSSGMIKATLAAVPTRWQVLVGKTTAMVALLLVVLSAGVAGAFFAGNAVLASGHSATSHWSAPGREQ
jgi:ABC-type transport system involved in multi-copper enzyme maturation permease subunit